MQQIADWLEKLGMSEYAHGQSRYLLNWRLPLELPAATW